MEEVKGKALRSIKRDIDEEEGRIEEEKCLEEEEY